MGVFFLLVLVIVQIGFLLLARSMVSTSVDAAARRASWSNDGGHDDAARLEAEVTAAVPGVDITSSDITRQPSTVTVHVQYRWSPPGPDLLPATFTVERSRVVAVPP